MCLALRYLLAASGKHPLDVYLEFLAEFHINQRRYFAFHLLLSSSHRHRWLRVDLFVEAYAYEFGRLHPLKGNLPLLRFLRLRDIGGSDIRTSCDIFFEAPCLSAVGIQLDIPLEKLSFRRLRFETLLLLPCHLKTSATSCKHMDRTLSDSDSRHSYTRRATENH